MGTIWIPHAKGFLRRFFEKEIHPNPRTPIPLRFPPNPAGYLQERLRYEGTDDRDDARRAESPAAAPVPAAAAPHYPPALEAEGEEVAPQPPEESEAAADSNAAEELYGSERYVM